LRSLGDPPVLLCQRFGIWAKHVSTNTIKTIREKLAPEAFEEFKAETSSMPAWMTNTMRHYERELAGA